MKKNAFTLIEIIAVIMIIAIIVGIALPRFSGVQDEALITKAKGELRTIQAAVESYYMHQTPNAYPDTTTTLIADNLLNASPQITSQVLYDPFLPSPEEYNYVRSNNARYYVIFSVGPDAAADITDIDDAGALQGAEDDDIFVTNGSGW